MMQRLPSAVMLTQTPGTFADRALMIASSPARSSSSAVTVLEDGGGEAAGLLSVRSLGRTVVPVAHAVVSQQEIAQNAAKRGVFNAI